MNPTRKFRRGNSINALPTGFGNLVHLKGVARRKKIKRLLRKSSFTKRSGYAIDVLLEDITLAICTGARGTLAVSSHIRDASIGCKASKATLNRVYGYATDENLDLAMRLIPPRFRNKGGGIWAIDGTFIHVHGGKFEYAAQGYDSSEDKVNLGYLLITVFDVYSKKPIYWKLLPGNASENKVFSSILTEAMGASGEIPEIVVFDRGYLSKENIGFLKGHGILWVSQATGRMKVSDHKHTHSPRDWFTYYERGKSRKVYWRGFGPVLMVREEEIRNGKLMYWRVLIGSPELSPGQIIRLYNRRWGIEEYHKQLRALGLNVLPTGRFLGLKLHVLLVVLAYLLLHSVEWVLRCPGASVITIMRAVCVAGLVSGPS